jgi:hypothetical protein
MHKDFYVPWMFDIFIIVFLQYLQIDELFLDVNCPVLMVTTCRLLRQLTFHVTMPQDHICQQFYLHVLQVIFG